MAEQQVAKAEWNAASDALAAEWAKFESNPEGWDDADSDRLIDARSHLLNLPSPDRGALLAKLEILFEDDGSDSLIAWNRQCVRQTLQDMRSLLA